MTKEALLNSQKWQWREFTELFLRNASAPPEAALKHVDNWLADKTYLVGTEATSIDTDVFKLIHSPLSRLSHQEREAYPHLSRWFRLVQSSVPPDDRCPPLVISRTRLYA
ncbi:eukaryotic translation elongation factor 1 epsilon-1-like [Amphibalanus amphitrite]|uniref:eukaryotic translation elongation factor 1 epsilon-1-like n=1 Tax=Amphibalanus amphitrite TaxID=1232801 RepID=UPI001C8FA930|nr:eukaryotic translation elongation factor 1 epsilon-1-like [Amphibalanus amphitrite]